VDISKPFLQHNLSNALFTQDVSLVDFTGRFALTTVDRERIEETKRPRRSMLFKDDPK
jgi:hypothetical protein